MANLLFSVLICTHNRAAYLGLAIDSVLKQRFTGYELVIIDNASTDETQAVVEARLPNERLRYVYESRLGLSHARNRGASEASGQILVYLDDDAVASPQWLQALSEVFAADERVAIAGGKVTLIWPEGAPPPQWLSPALTGCLGAYDLGDAIVSITEPGLTPRGLNYALRKTFWSQLGGFDAQLGRVGKNLLSNEELHMTQQALKREWKVVYTPDALVGHHVASERLQRRWFLRRSWWQGISECYREQLEGQLTWDSLRDRSLCLGRGLAKAMRYWNRSDLRFDNLVYAYGQLGYLTNGLRACLNPQSEALSVPGSSLKRES